MAIDKLGLYNIACMAMGERTLDSLSEEGEARRYLDEVYTRGNGLITTVLEMGLWNFAMKAITTDASTSVTPSFGFSYAFTKPSDWVRLNQISADENFSDPLTHYEFEAQYIYADVDPLYLRYVSDDSSYGADLSLWPDSFSLWVGHWMATQVAPSLKNDLDMDKLEKRTMKLYRDTKSKDAQEEPPRFPPQGSWSRARYGGRNLERGKRSALTG